MTGNPIFVRYGMAHLAQCEDWEWTCTRCKATPGTYGFEWTAGEAADAGREHLRRHHGYSRACGVHTASCGANVCRCVSVDPGDGLGPHRTSQSVSPDDLCHGCGATNGVCPCTTNPLQAAHNEGVRR